MKLNVVRHGVASLRRARFRLLECARPFRSFVRVRSRRRRRAHVRREAGVAVDSSRTTTATSRTPGWRDSMVSTSPARRGSRASSPAVDASEELDRPVVAVPRVVARPVQPAPGRPAERIGDELLRRQLRAPAVAAREAVAADVQLAGTPTGTGSSARRRRRAGVCAIGPPIGTFVAPSATSSTRYHAANVVLSVGP